MRTEYDPVEESRSERAAQTRQKYQEQGPASEDYRAGDTPGDPYTTLKSFNTTLEPSAFERVYREIRRARAERERAE